MNSARNHMRALVYAWLVWATVAAPAKNNKPDTKEECLNCVETHIVSVDEDFTKLKADPAVKVHVAEILQRLDTFKVPVHPRIRIFYELLKVAMSEHAHRTADSLYVPDKYNVAAHANGTNKA